MKHEMFFHIKKRMDLVVHARLISRQQVVRRILCLPEVMLFMIPPASKLLPTTTAPLHLAVQFKPGAARQGIDSH